MEIVFKCFCEISPGFWQNKSFFPLSRSVAFQGRNQETMPVWFSTNSFFSSDLESLYLNIFCSNSQNTKFVGWEVMLTFQLNYKHRACPCVAAVEEIFRAAVTMIAIKSWRSNSLYSRLKSLAFVIFSTEKQHIIISFRFSVCNFPQYQLPSMQRCSR